MSKIHTNSYLFKTHDNHVDKRPRLNYEMTKNIDIN